MTIAWFRIPALLGTAMLLVAAALLAAALIPGFDNWMGFGFDASSPELARLKQALALKAGMVVADVGAGKGELTRALADTVGPGGRAFATEVDPDRLTALRAMVDAGKSRNVTIVEADSRDSRLPAGCCDAIVLRRVYHHLTDPAETIASLLRALRPGGLLAVIDMPPPVFIGRGSFGVPAQSVVDEVTATGFEMVHLHRDWPRPQRAARSSASRFNRVIADDDSRVRRHIRHAYCSLMRSWFDSSCQRSSSDRTLWL